MALKVIFWLSVCGVLYPYIGYPFVLVVLGRLRRRRAVVPASSALPSISMIVPVYNEESWIARKVQNTMSLQYPVDRLQVLFVSDGSTDRTVEIIREHASSDVSIVQLPVRRGKAEALNAGLERAAHDIVVFTDASIALQPDALQQLVGPFGDPGIGCVSGEDRIAESGGEAWYGRYELLLRRLESQAHSIVGASGPLYAQRRAICQPFQEGMAPDFLSVLRTLEQGYRAVSEPSAVGAMTSVKDPRQEFGRKVRTLIRGMTTLFANKQLLSLRRFGLVAFALWSHKILRWTVPFFLVLALVSSMALASSPLYLAAFVAQVLFYAGALAALAELGSVHRSLPGKAALYFSSVNAAILTAWCQYGQGVRQELWTPSRR